MNIRSAQTALSSPADWNLYVEELAELKHMPSAEAVQLLRSAGVEVRVISDAWYASNYVLGRVSLIIKDDRIISLMSG